MPTKSTKSSKSESCDSSTSSKLEEMEYKSSVPRLNATSNINLAEEIMKLKVLNR